ncbi:MAG: hypothetical protein CMJ18_01645 [Phycisphaeraceae bacterium]|nr:hypothetical protein [Phycisphaeraceae bacterium]
MLVAKPVVPGRVKPRLIGPLTALEAAEVHRLMLQCVLERLADSVADTGHGLVLALDGTCGAAARTLDLPAAWRVIDQGPGDLGERMAGIWSCLGGGPAAFFGADCPDVPRPALRSAVAAMARPGASIGPTEDGGYWTLAASGPVPALLSGIDWGTPSVYHQTREAARRGGIAITDLDHWADVDTHEDLQALRRRLMDQDEPVLVRLRAGLDRLHRESRP